MESEFTGFLWLLRDLKEVHRGSCCSPLLPMHLHIQPEKPKWAQEHYSPTLLSLLVASHAYFMIPAYSLYLVHPGRHPSTAWSISAWQMFPRSQVLELQDLLEVLPFLAGALTESVLKYRDHTLYTPRLVCKTKDLSRAQEDQSKFC